MSLLTSLLRELENPNLSVNDRVERCCEATRDLENAGEYEDAQKALRNYWPRIGEAPTIAGLEESTAAELLLRAGVITGIIGASRQIPDAQEIAKDLITQSQSIFESHQAKKKIAEARTELGYCYWRTSDLNEARDCFKEAISLLPNFGDLKAKAILRLSVCEHSMERDQQEHEVIKFALEQTNGKVTAAARLARMSHQSFTYAIKTRHKDLLDKTEAATSKQRERMM